MGAVRGANLILSNHWNPEIDGLINEINYYIN
jgi:hypothetical protein